MRTFNLLMLLVKGGNLTNTTLLEFLKYMYNAL
jgi:hypothetical protein